MSEEPASPCANARLQIFGDEGDVFQHTATLITNIIRDSLLAKQTSNVIVASGRSVTQTLSCLPPDALNWNQVNWFMADERCVDKDEGQRNDRQIRDVLQRTLGAKCGLVIGPRPEIGLQDSVAEYASRINNIQMFDFCLLGLGDDGHIASLFPGHRALHASESCLLIMDSPKPPAKRITLGMATLCNSKNRIVVATGRSKKQAVLEIANNSQSPLQFFKPTDLIFDLATSQ